MNLSLYKKAKAALRASLDKNIVKPELVHKQLRLLKSERLSERLRILKLYRQLIERAQKKETVWIQLPSEIDSQTKKGLEEIVSRKFGSRGIEFQVKPELIGGLRLKFGDTSIDYSLLGRLEEIREAFV